MRCVGANVFTMELVIKCHSVSTIRSAQRQFFVLLSLVVALCVYVEVKRPLPLRMPEPAPAVPGRFYLTSECGYDRRLGNVMFTYAAMLGIAYRNNLTAILSFDTPLTEVFEGLDIQLLGNLNRVKSGSFEYHEYGRRGSAYDRSTAKLFKQVNRTNVYLRGYFQSWRYFENVVDVVRRNFIFKKKISSKAENFLQTIIPSNWREVNAEFVRVGVHVRRGDMANDAYYRDYGYTVAPGEYFVKAMRMFVDRYSRVQFVVCSDDMRWSEANVPRGQYFDSESVDVVFSKGRSQFDDLAILARCDHVILSVGSFGWWAAWLANGTSVYYENWPRPFSKLEYHVDKRDYFPVNWIKLS